MTRQMSLMKVENPLAPGPRASAPVLKLLTWRDFVGIFRRRLVLIFIITTLTTIASVGLYFVLRIYRPRYTSRADIECKMPVQDNPLAGTVLRPQTDIIEMEAQNQSLYLKGERFLSSVLSRTTVQDTQWGKQREGDPEKRMKDLQSSFSAAPQRDTAYVRLSMTMSSADEAKLILEEILKQFRIEKVQEAGGELTDRLLAIVGEREKLDEEIINKNSKLLSLIQEAQEPGFETGQTRYLDEFKMMHNDNLILETQLADAEQMWQDYEDEMKKRGYLPMVRVEVENTPMVLSLRNQITAQQSQLSQLRERFGEDHQILKEMRSGIASLGVELDQLRQQLQVEYSQMQLLSLDREIQRAKVQQQAVLTKYQFAEGKLEELVSSRVDYMKTERERNDLMPQLRRLEEQEDIIRIQQQGAEADRVRVVIPTNASPPLGLSSPRLSLYLPGGIFMGLVFSVGLVFLLEFMDDSIKTPSDVRRYLNIPLLGMIPLNEEEAVRGAAVARVAYLYPQAVMSEAYRQVRTNLFFSAPIEELKTILVTSSSAGGGNTTTAVNLGITLAAEGKRVLLIDANFRRAFLNHLFPVEGPPRGLSNILVGQLSAAEVIHHSEVEGLDVVDTGPAPPNPAVLLGNERMKDLVDSQKQHYDHIILDGPPSLLVTDAQVLAGMVDGTIVVVHAGDTSRGALQRMVSELRNNRVNILGILLNAVRPHKGGYFRESHRSYYDYISSEGAPRVKLPGAKGGGKAE